jgi:hypothetical protein
LAYGILHLRGVDGRAGWSWLFALEGTLTGLVGIASYFYLPPSPYQTASKVRGAGWFTEHEERIMANRILRDDPGKGDMHNRQGLSWTAFKSAITDYHMWPIYLIGLSWNVPVVPIQGYITLNLVAIGFGTFETSLLVIPAFVLFIAGLLVGFVQSLIVKNVSDADIQPLVLDISVRAYQRAHPPLYRKPILDHRVSRRSPRVTAISE